MTNDNADDGDGTASSSSSPWQPWPSEALAMAQCALDLTRQDWTLTGHTMPTTTTTTNTNGSDSTNGSNTGVEEIAERIVSLLLIRIVALVTCRLGNIPAPSPVDNNGAELDGGDNESVNTINTSNHSADSIKGSSSKNNNNNNNNKHHPKLYPDYSTTTICTIALPSAPPPRRQFPSAITPAVIAQLRRYVRAICRRYRGAEEVPYHNVEHAYHVFLSANKLLDLMLCEEEEEEGSSELDSTDRMDDRANSTDNKNNSNNGGEDDDDDDNYIMVAGRRRRRGRCATTESTGTTITTATTSSKSHSKSKPEKRKRRRTFGIKSDPLSQLALLFSALVHDVDHTGISNRQLVLEMDDLAILYNDQSAAEQRSLAVAFRTLKGRGYGELREVLFPTSTSTSTGGLGGSDRSDDHDHDHDHAPAAASSGGIMLGNEDFFKFRKLVIDLVLVTDIASPERTQIVKSKWKEAFGEVIVAEKLRKSMMTPNNSTCDDDGGSGGAKGGVKGGGGGGDRGSSGAARGASMKSGNRGKPNRSISFDTDVL